MMPAARLLSAVCAAAVTIAAAVVLISDSRWTAPPARMPDLPPELEDAFVGIDDNAALVGEIARRPLFVPGRSPIVVAQEPVVAASPDPFPPAELLGLFGSGAVAGVILRHEGKTERIAVGAEWLGWKLDWVDPGKRKATFSAAGKTSHELSLKRQPQMPQGTAGVTSQANNEGRSAEGDTGPLEGGQVEGAVDDPRSAVPGQTAAPRRDVSSAPERRVQRAANQTRQ